MASRDPFDRHPGAQIGPDARGRRTALRCQCRAAGAPCPSYRGCWVGCSLAAASSWVRPESSHDSWQARGWWLVSRFFFHAVLQQSPGHVTSKVPMNSKRGMVDRLGRWDAVATIQLLEGPHSTSSARVLFPKRRQFSWWQVTVECQMKRAHAGKRVIKRHWRRSSPTSTMRNPQQV